jgi:hypothetical protein
MKTEPARVSFDQDGQQLEGEVVSSKLTPTKLMKICMDDTGVTIVRHADRVTPLNEAARKFLRKGAAVGNQDIAGVSKEIIRQSSVWLLGVQREANEIRRTLAHIPAGLKKPKADDVARIERQGAAIKAEIADLERRLKSAAVVHLAPALAPVPAPVSDRDLPWEIPGANTTKEAVGSKNVARLVVDRAHQHPKNRTPMYDAKGWTSMEEELYQKFKARLVAELMDESPKILQVIATKPELEVVVEKEVLPVDGKTSIGRVARLISKGFFEDYQTAIETFREVNSTGASTDRRTVLGAMDKLVEMGFLFKNTNGFKAVPGMKVNVKEVSR